jgi:drug/metabolite transporter (DMT)-like permease
MAWVIYSLIAAVGFGSITLILTYLSRANMSSIVVNAWFWATTALIFIVAGIITSTKDLKIHTSYVKWFILLAIVAFITNYFSVKAFQTGPNTGVVRSIQIAQIAVAAIGGYYIFHQGVSPRAGLGMAFLVVGLLLIIIK